MDFSCERCGNCCRLFCFVSLDDINRWLDEDRIDIVSCLTRHIVHGRRPPEMLHIPMKKDIISHSFLKEFYKAEFNNSRECIFFNNAACMIYNTRPESCKSFPMRRIQFPCPGKKDVTSKDIVGEQVLTRELFDQSVKIFKDLDLVSRSIKLAKNTVDRDKLRNLINPEVEDVRKGCGGFSQEEEKGTD